MGYVMQDNEIFGTNLSDNSPPVKDKLFALDRNGVYFSSQYSMSDFSKYIKIKIREFFLNDEKLSFLLQEKKEIYTVTTGDEFFDSDGMFRDKSNVNDDIKFIQRKFPQATDRDAALFYRVLEGVKEEVAVEIGKKFPMFPKNTYQLFEGNRVLNIGLIACGSGGNSSLKKEDILNEIPIENVSLDHVFKKIENKEFIDYHSKYSDIVLENIKKILANPFLLFSAFVVREGLRYNRAVYKFNPAYPCNLIRLNNNPTTMESHELDDLMDKDVAYFVFNDSIYYKEKSGQLTFLKRSSQIKYLVAPLIPTEGKKEASVTDLWMIQDITKKTPFDRPILSQSDCNLFNSLFDENGNWKGVEGYELEIRTSVLSDNFGLANLSCRDKVLMEAVLNVADSSDNVLIPINDIRMQCWNSTGHPLNDLLSSFTFFSQFAVVLKDRTSDEYDHNEGQWFDKNWVPSKKILNQFYSNPPEISSSFLEENISRFLEEGKSSFDGNDELNPSLVLNKSFQEVDNSSEGLENIFKGLDDKLTKSNDVNSSERLKERKLLPPPATPGKIRLQALTAGLISGLLVGGLVATAMLFAPAVMFALFATVLAPIALPFIIGAGVLATLVVGGLVSVVVGVRGTRKLSKYNSSRNEGVNNEPSIVWDPNKSPVIYDPVNKQNPRVENSHVTTENQGDISGNKSQVSINKNTMFYHQSDTTNNNGTFVKKKGTDYGP